MVPHVVPIDTDHPQPVPIVPDVVPIDRGLLHVVPIVPDVVPIDRDHPMLFPHASVVTYVVPGDWDDIRHHICHSHVIHISSACCPCCFAETGMTSGTTHTISTSSACNLCGPQCGSH